MYFLDLENVVDVSKELIVKQECINNDIVKTDTTESDFESNGEEIYNDSLKNPEDKEIECDICYKRYNSSYINEHRRRHTGYKNYFI